MEISPCDLLNMFWRHVVDENPEAEPTALAAAAALGALLASWAEGQEDAIAPIAGWYVLALESVATTEELNGSIADLINKPKIQDAVRIARELGGFRGGA